MNKKVLSTLEYNKVTSRLADFASSELGKQLCLDMEPLDDIGTIELLQTQTSDALSLIWKKGSISFRGIHDITPSLKRLGVGSPLNGRELLQISSLLNVALKVKTYTRKEEEDIPDSSLDEMFRSIEPLSNLNNDIKRCIVSEEEVADDASPELRTIRRKIRQANEQIHTKLNSMVNSTSTRTYLQDNVVTMRNGRYCIPVRQEYRSQVPGMIHDQSSSGSTLFIEPMAVVKLNNDLKELFAKEQEEIDAVLASLSNQTAVFSEELASDLSILTALDFIFARAAFSKSIKGSRPSFNTEGDVYLKDARHPLLDPDRVVPIDIWLGRDFTMLIVTGPNTGGKTVSLKTVGLLTLMGQSGLHIPAFDGSRLAVFKEVYADIGDEQSIEQNLSTFSSHMVNTVRILEHADKDSLVLFDELGAGTDPTEGAALAIAILHFLHNMQVRTMVTTHYSELKVYALSTSGVENACCEFDVETLQPTYRLLIGVPGKSNAFAISQKLGLPPFIIDDARNRIDQNDIAFEDLLTDLENSRITIENERMQINAYRQEAELLKKQLEQKSQILEEKRRKILNQANEEAYRVLQEAREFADTSIKNIRKLAASADTKELDAERSALRQKTSEAGGKLAIGNKPKPSRKYSAKDFKPGDMVKVLSLGLTGTVTTVPNARGNLYVQMGILRSQVNISDLEPVDEPVISAPNMQMSSSGKIKMSKSESVATEIKLIGMTVDEAIPNLDKYLDDAYLAHLPSVRVVHGRGTGALRNAVHKHLKKLNYVKSFRLGSFGEGDSGVTIVEFK
ncbi:endonuclease MutS2 [Parasporobacterium paucivorans]|uniref:Endonuclease MutS2 n=1 Tax=Parasporobacterium paucivorans DSM 15970 TaxID=1122934 RepID=A0A1M6CVJ4_9FIRM|nr:endonuclease MutS2 [Parasporobacterium paucivorans]SHI65037.1 DNA mismatch repair protein MutS2 [Parasporobacterium paucivorans DSM 15970]